jgi:hypothetical protein
MYNSPDRNRCYDFDRAHPLLDRTNIMRLYCDRKPISSCFTSGVDGTLSANQGVDAAGKPPSDSTALESGMAGVRQ